MRTAYDASKRVNRQARLKGIVYKRGASKVLGDARNAHNLNGYITPADIASKWPVPDIFQIQV